MNIYQLFKSGPNQSSPIEDAIKKLSPPSASNISLNIQGPELPKEEDEKEFDDTDDTKMETDLLFVYGSLKRGGYLSHALKDAQFIGEFVTRKSKYELMSPNESFPALKKGKYRISGELYKINKKILNDVDWIEGHPQLFIRSLVKIHGIKEKAYVYRGSDRLFRTYDQTFTWKSSLIKTDGNVQSWIIE